MTQNQTSTVPLPTGEHDRFGHLVLGRGAIGVLQEALCGKIWISQGWGTGGFPECPTCYEIFDSMTASKFTDA